MGEYVIDYLLFRDLSMLYLWQFIDLSDHFRVLDHEGSAFVRNYRNQFI